MRIGFLGLLALLFITLKLCHVLAWSWMWVLAPLWIPGTFLAGLGAVWLLLYALVAWGNHAAQRKRRNNHRSHG